MIGVFPEGTALPDKKRGYKRGAARLALASGAPLVPLCLIGTEQTLEPRTHRVRFPRVEIVIGEPLRVERQEPTEEAATELTARLEATIKALRGAPVREATWFRRPPNPGRDDSLACDPDLSCA